MTTSPSPGFRSGFVALAGCPNVGKSTLLNRLLGEKIAIATPLPQTTRRIIRGVLTLPGSQIVFLDTPGFHKPKFALNESMVRAAEGALTEVDVVVMLVDAGRDPGEGDNLVAARALAAGVPVILALNKWDTVPEAARAARRAAYTALGPFAEMVTVCALEPAAATTLLPPVLARLPEGPAYYPDDEITDQTLRDLVCELVREQVILQCAEEIPYAVAVSVDKYQEGDDGDRVWATIYVERDSQKGILIGKGGARIKALGQAARAQMEQVTGQPVHLRLFVKVQPNWRKDTQFLREMGYRS
ncbi:MAG: GTPase Era [Nitrospirae bacterium]|nr:GTPase Era [Nitrospirota bacterium]